MAQFGSKNTPWGRPPGAQQLNPQIFTGQLSGMNAFAVSQAMGLGAAGLGALGGGVISTVNPAAFAQQQPSAAALASAFPAAANAAVAAAVSRQQQQVAQAVAHQQQQQQQHQQQQQQGKNNQRTFIGTVTKLHENYGFIDDEVFFQTTVCRGAVPRIGDRVMVEATFNANMPFKWNAVRIQLLPQQEQPQMVQPSQHQQSQPGGSRQVQAPPMRQSRDDRWSSDRREPLPPRRERSPLPPRRSPIPARRSPVPLSRRSPIPRRRSPSPGRHGSSIASGSFKRERSPAAPSPNRDLGIRGASRSPPRRRPRLATSRSVGTIPKMLLDTREFGVFDVRKHYPNMYIPSDFLHCDYEWINGLPSHRPLSLDHYATYHVMNKDVDNLEVNDAVLDPPDADYKHCAKVMLLSLPGIQEIYKKTIGLDDSEGYLKNGPEFSPMHLQSIVGFLVGIKGKTEVLSIGGPWSPSLDGADPEDAKVMVRCAIRTTKALTGIDLSKCTQWYKFLEIRYRRTDKSGQHQQRDDQQQRAKGLFVFDSPRIDTVTIFLPDVWRVVPNKLEFENLHSSLKKQLESKIAALYEPLPTTPPPVLQAIGSTQLNSTSDADITSANAATELRTNKDDTSASIVAEHAADTSERSKINTMASAKPEAEEEEKTTNGEKEPTHWNQLDIKSMKVNELRIELSARNLDSKGIKSQLVARLMKAVKAEQEAEDQAKAEIDAAQATVGDDGKADLVIDEALDDTKPREAQELGAKDVEMKSMDESELNTTQFSELTASKSATESKEEQKPKMRDEKEIREMKSRLERAYDFRPNQHGILVYPNRLAKSGKFDCRVMSLSNLLDYRPEDNKEHSFEVSLFAEAFSQMLARDNAFNIFKALAATPDPEAEKDKEEKSDEKKGKDDGTTNPQETEKGKDTTTESMDKEDVSDGNGNGKEASKDVDKKEASKTSIPQSSGKKEKKDEKTKRRSRSPSPIRDDKKLVKPIDAALLQSFVYFDQGYSGYIASRDLEDILLSLGLRLTRSQMQKLTKKVINRDVLNYRKLTDVVYLKDTKEKKSEPEFLQLPPDEELAIGNSALVSTRKETESASKTPAKASRRSTSAAKSEIVDVSAVGTVMYMGSIVDVGQVLSQIEKLEQERKALEQRLTTLDKDLSHYKDQKHSLERRKRRLDDDLKDAKKRLYDAEKCLKNSQDDTVQLKTSLHRCKEYSESIARLVDKTLPSKRDKDETSSERSERTGKNKSSTAEKTETQEAATADNANVSADSVPSVTTDQGDSQNATEEAKMDTGEMAAEERSPAPDEELAVREEVTESDRTEAELNSMLTGLNEGNMQE